MKRVSRRAPSRRNIAFSRRFAQRWRRSLRLAHRLLAGRTMPHRHSVPHQGTPRVVAFMLLTAAAGCGGRIADDDRHHASTVTPAIAPLLPDGGGSTTPGVAPTSSSLSAGPWSCPTRVPRTEESCSISRIECEYGDRDESECNLVATCRGSGSWTLTPPDQKCLQDRIDDSICDAAGGGSDAPCDTDAVYGVCTTHLGDSVRRCGCYRGEDGFLRLGCSESRLQPGCPWPRPRLGSPCGTNARSCDYGRCMSGAASHVESGHALECDHGVWMEAPAAACAR